MHVTPTASQLVIFDPIMTQWWYQKKEDIQDHVIVVLQSVLYCVLSTFG